MASEKQIAANRRNAQRSTGPVTPEGKAAVSQNAFKHGLRAHGVLCTPTPEELQSLRDPLIAEWRPHTQDEWATLDEMAHALYQLARLHERETEWASRWLEPDFTPALLILSRRQASLARKYHQALRKLAIHRLSRDMEPLAENACFHSSPALESESKMNEQSQFPPAPRQCAFSFPPSAAPGDAI